VGWSSRPLRDVPHTLQLCILGAIGWSKNLLEWRVGKKQRFIRMPLKGDRMVGGYAEEHSTLRQG
jgi:hypothetical protein